MSPRKISITEKAYPYTPGKEEISDYYTKLREDASYLVRSRSQYQSLVERQKGQIMQLEGELVEFSNDIQLTLKQKAELNKIINRYGEVMGDLEKAGEELADQFEKNGAWGVFSISALVEAVRSFVSSYRAAVLRAKDSRINTQLQEADERR